MAISSDFLGLALLDTGEQPGLWGVTLNVNFKLIDLALKGALTAQAAAGDTDGNPPANVLNAGAGSLWFDTSIEILKVLNKNGVWQNVSKHDHTGNYLNIDKIDLDLETKGVLPGARVGMVGNNAEYLGSIHYSEYVHDADNGLEIVNGVVRPAVIPGLTPGQYTLISFDERGNLIAAQRPSNIAALGINDVYTKTTIDSFFGWNQASISVANYLSSNYYNKAYCDANFADKALEHSHTIGENDYRYALKNGENSVKFAVAAPDNGNNTDSNYVIPKGMADARYARKVAIAGVSREIIGMDWEFNANAYYTMSTQGILTNDADKEIVNRKFIVDYVTQNADITGMLKETVADSKYHPLNGGIAPFTILKVPAPSDSNDAVNYGTLQSELSSSISSHEAAGHPQYEDIINSIPTVDQHTNAINTVIERPFNEGGAVDYLKWEQSSQSPGNLNVFYQIPPNTSQSASELRASCANGYGGFPGDKNIILALRPGFDNLYTYGKISLNPSANDNATIKSEFAGVQFTLSGDTSVLPSPVQFTFVNAAPANTTEVDIRTGEIELIAKRLADAITASTPLKAASFGPAINIEPILSNTNPLLITIDNDPFGVLSETQSVYDPDNGIGVLSAIGKIAFIPQNLPTLSGGADPVEDYYYIVIERDPVDPNQIDRLSYIEGTKLPIKSETPPASPTVGQLWFDPNTKALYKWGEIIDNADPLNPRGTGVYDWITWSLVPIAYFTSTTATDIVGLTYIETNAPPIFAGGDSQDPPDAVNIKVKKTLTTKDLNITGEVISDIVVASGNDINVQDASETVATHINDSTKHRTINDAGTSTTELWSSDKISTELALKADDSAVNTALGGKADLAGSATQDFATKDLSVNGPLSLAIYTVATLPDATAYTGALIFVSDETGGPTVAFSDGTNWLRIYDNTVVA